MKEDWEIIYENMIAQKTYLKEVAGLNPQRVIIGLNAYDIIWKHFSKELNASFEKEKPNQLVGLPYTIDFGDRDIIMVCHGTTADIKKNLEITT